MTVSFGFTWFALQKKCGMDSHTLLFIIKYANWGLIDLAPVVEAANKSPSGGKQAFDDT